MTSYHNTPSAFDDTTVTYLGGVDEEIAKARAAVADLPRTHVHRAAVEQAVAAVQHRQVELNKTKAEADRLYRSARPIAEVREEFRALDDTTPTPPAARHQLGDLTESLVAAAEPRPVSDPGREQLARDTVAAMVAAGDTFELADQVKADPILAAVVRSPWGRSYLSANTPEMADRVIAAGIGVGDGPRAAVQALAALQRIHAADQWADMAEDSIRRRLRSRPSTRPHELTNA